MRRLPDASATSQLSSRALPLMAAMTYIYMALRRRDGRVGRFQWVHRDQVYREAVVHKGGDEGTPRRVPPGDHVFWAGRNASRNGEIALRIGRGLVDMAARIVVGVGPHDLPVAGDPHQPVGHRR